MDLFLKNDLYYFAVSESNLHIYIERDKRHRSYSYTIQPGIYSWESIKLFKLEVVHNKPSLRIEFDSGNDLSVFITTMNTEIEELLKLKQCEPDPEDQEFQEKREQVETAKRKNMLIGFIIFIITIIFFYLVFPVLKQRFY